MKTNEKLKIILKLSGLTQTQLAGELKVSYPTLNSWVGNKSTPHSQKIKRVDELYIKYSGKNITAQDPLNAKKEILKFKKLKNKNLIKTINSRIDIFEQIILSFTYNTNSIEGSTLTENDTAAILFRNETIKNKGLVEHLEAKNHQTALEYLLKLIKPNFKITEEFILKLHEILMNSIRPDAGTYRSHGVRIVGANIPTANYIKVPHLMTDLISEINKKNEDIIKHVAIIHSKFEKIHPFSDGNGRIGRLIIAAMLLRKNYAPAIIKQNKKKLYYKYLNISQHTEQYDQLEEFICDSILNGYTILEV